MVHYPACGACNDDEAVGFHSEKRIDVRSLHFPSDFSSILSEYFMFFHSTVRKL